jgi:hypothetical protein
MLREASAKHAPRECGPNIEAAHEVPSDGKKTSDVSAPLGAKSLID